MHTPPPPLQLLGCGVEIDVSHKPPPPHPSLAFRSVLVGFRAASAGMGWIRATHSCAVVCSLLAYLCRGGGGGMVEEGDPARGHLAVLRSDLSIKAFHINSTHGCTYGHKSTHGQSVCFCTHVDVAHLRNVSNISTACAPLAYITARTWLRVCE